MMSLYGVEGLQNVVLVNKGDTITVTITTETGNIIPTSALEVK